MNAIYFIQQSSMNAATCAYDERGTSSTDGSLSAAELCYLKGAVFCLWSMNGHRAPKQGAVVCLSSINGHRAPMQGADLFLSSLSVIEPQSRKRAFASKVHAEWVFASHIVGICISYRRYLHFIVCVPASARTLVGDVTPRCGWLLALPSATSAAAAAAAAAVPAAAAEAHHSSRPPLRLFGGSGGGDGSASLIAESSRLVSGGGGSTASLIVTSFPSSPAPAPAWVVLSPPIQ